jgi:ATP-dependent DNA helicase RecQ
VVNAQQDAGGQPRALAARRAGEVRLLYIAPERFSSPGFAEALREARVGLFVVDEAHCVSQWGHDFRPDYFRLADAARWLGARAIVASTATATPQVAADIARRLGLRDPVRITTGFDRPNLSFVVVPCRGVADKRARLAAALEADWARPAIVYAGTRAETEDLAGALQDALGIGVLAYHAGLDRARRAAGQRRFMAGDVEVVVATNAFGMGIDKADVRTVAHATVPGSLEAYYQEAGRAGRDGLPARALLFAESRDKGLHVFFIQRAEVDDAAMAGRGGRRGRRGGRRPLRPAGGRRGRSGARARSRDRRPPGPRRGRTAGARPGRSPARARARPVRRARAALCRSSAGDAQRARWRQYRSAWAFVEGSSCRREAILRHFGDRAAPRADVPCCDVCAADLVPATPAPIAVPGGPAPGDLDAAIVDVVGAARPAVGRTRTVEILRGGRSQLVRRNAYDGLPAYGAFGHLRADEVLARVDELLEEGRLVSTGGAYPKLRVRRAAA